MRWYNDRRPGLGAEFANELFFTTESTMRRPFVVRPLEHQGLSPKTEFRKVQLKRFSEYGVIYAVMDETFWILAVAHAKRRPDHWVERTTGLP